MKIFIKNLNNVLLFIVCYLLFVNSANAQFNLPNLGMNPTLSLTLDSQTPLPNSGITATANLSGITNVNNSDYTWFLNGVKQKIASGVNKNTFSFQVGDLGAVYKIGISVTMPDGENLSDSISSTVSDFDLSWSASSQAPAEYRGKLLPTQNSTVVVSALPFIYQPGTKTFITGNNLIFNWRIDDKFSVGSSGIGKSSITFVVNDYAGGSKSVQLEIKTADGAVSIIKSAAIPIARPQVLIYLADAKTNFPFGAALKNLTVKPLNLNFAAQNYFFNALPKDMNWQWLVDNKEVADGSGKPWLASLNIPNTGRSFFTQIQATAKNPVNNLETAQSTINLEVK